MFEKLLGTVASWFRSEPVVYDYEGYDPHPVPVSRTDEGRNYQMIAGGKCPHCKSLTRFFEGPSGGLSTNIQCENCGWWWNVTQVLGYAESIGEQDDRPKKNPPWRPELPV